MIDDWCTWCQNICIPWYFPMVVVCFQWMLSGGVSTREASVIMVENVAETGDETSSFLVITSTNLVLTVTFSVLLAIVFQRIYEVVTGFNARWGFVKELVDICLVYICNQVSCFGFLCCSYHPIGRGPFVFHSWCLSLYVCSMSPSFEKADSDSHVALVIGYPFHFT